jgi:hypothetical protein
MLNVQTYLLTHTLNDLIRDHGVYARFSTKNPLKFSLNYDQLEAKDADPIAQECRGLVLSTEEPLADMDPTLGAMGVTVGVTKVRGLPMGRFFNYGQGSAALVDLDSPETRFCEKLDGTLCIMYWDRHLGVWSVATRSVPDADLPMDGFGNQTFSDLFWKAFKASGGMISQLDYARGWHTFCFELCTPDNQIVVKYDDYKVYLLAARENETHDNMDPQPWAAQMSVECAPTYRFGNTQEMLDFVSSRNPLAHEGIVVVDKDFNRVKVKNAGYLAYNKIKDSVAKSPRAVMEIILLGKEDDVMPLVPAHVQQIILDTKANLAKFLVAMDEEYTECYNADRKTFALAIQARSGNMGPQMARWGGKCTSTKDWIFTNRKDGSWADSFLDTVMRMCKDA